MRDGQGSRAKILSRLPPVYGVLIYLLRLSAKQERKESTVETEIFVDNTTFAAAGRVLYHGDMGTEGGVHAADYYGRYKDAQQLDRASFLELLTALLLFDRLIWWDGSSADVGENEMVDVEPGEPWVYAWFPLFREARETYRAIDDVGRWGNDHVRLDRAREAALRCMSEIYDTFPFPKGFRVPVAYRDQGYRDLPYIRDLQHSLGIDLSEEALQVAMFLQRGIFYQSQSFQMPGLSYLPHSYRACLLSHPRVASLSLACTWQMVEGPKPVSGHAIMEAIGSLFAEEVESTFGLAGLEPAKALAAPFLLHAGHDPQEAFRKVLEFRESRGGQSARALMRELVALGMERNKLGIDARLQKIRRELQTIELGKFGHASRPRKELEPLMGLLPGRVNFALKEMWTLVPLSVQERVNQIAHTVIRPSGFQMVFSHYFQ